MSEAGFVYLVGAGPGDPGLVTLRARELISQAEVLIYDWLVHPDVLAWASPATRMEFMGKQGHAKQAPQDEITARIIACAKAGETVVRLKGGDPSIFGRLGEEAQALAEEGIPFEIIPGVTAAAASSALAAVPLTHRDHAPCVTFLTGHRRRDGGEGPSLNYEALAATGGTLVVYMGVKQLGEVAAGLIGAGASPDRPTLLVRRATWPEEELLEGTLGDIAERAERYNIKPPAVVIIGGVASLREQFAMHLGRKLGGRRILITRAADQTGEMKALIRSRGGYPVECPLIELRPYGHKSLVEATLRKIFAYDWAIFSSVNAVKYTFAKLDEMGLDARTFGAARVCAVGPKTAEALEARGIRPDVVPEQFVAESLIEAIKSQEKIESASVLMPRAREARELISEELEKLGARVDVLPLYENVRPEKAPPEAVEQLRDGRIDAVTLASSSAARNFAALCRDEGLDPTEQPCFAIGPATEKTARNEGLNLLATAEVYTVQGIVDCMERWFVSDELIEKETSK